MAKIQGEYILTLTESGVLEKREPVNANEGTITLREPTDEEWNNYDASKLEISKKGRLKKDRTGPERCKLFDRIMTSIDNIEDSGGFITLDSKERIPARYKQRAIFLCFEDERGGDDDEDIVKN